MSGKASQNRLKLYDVCDIPTVEVLIQRGLAKRDSAGMFLTVKGLSAVESRMGKISWGQVG